MLEADGTTLEENIFFKWAGEGLFYNDSHLSLQSALLAVRNCRISIFSIKTLHWGVFKTVNKCRKEGTFA